MPQCPPLINKPSPQATEAPQTKLEKYTNTKLSIGNANFESNFGIGLAALAALAALKGLGWVAGASGRGLAKTLFVDCSQIKFA